MKHKAIIVDIDGTIILKGGVPNESIINLMRQQDSEGINIIIVSARKEKYRDKTIIFFKDNNIPYDQMLLVWDDISELSSKYKAVKNIIVNYFDIVLAIDNNDEVIEAYESLGIKTFKA